MTFKERILSHVEIRSDDECWEWTAARTQSGYGKVHVGSLKDNTRRTARAHRVVYELLVGPIPEGLTIDHLCRNRACVNPKHLEPVTDRVNILRGDTLAARCAAKTHCVNGHPFDSANTVMYGRSRRCRECIRTRQRRYDAQRRDAQEIAS